MGSYHFKITFANPPLWYTILDISSNESHVNYLHIRYLLQGLAGRTLLSRENIANQRSTNLRSKMPLNNNV